jgi:hypothetical protein
LLLKPAPGVLLRVTHAANRRNTAIEIDESWIASSGGFVPLVLSIDVRRATSLTGEVACIGPLQEEVTIEARALADAPEVARAHVAFYDQDYFDSKKRGVSRKYRRHLTGETDTNRSHVARCEVIEAGPVKWSVRSAGPFVGAKRGAPVPKLDSAVFVSPFDFTAVFDGHTMSIDADPSDISRAAAAVEAVFTKAMDPSFVASNRGALWYLTKFFTPHPPGDPHFFVKPWSFFRTPAGWSSLLDGINGSGFDVLRGVVSTDSFFATPAVFRLFGEGARISVKKGQPLLRVIPVPRHLLLAGFGSETLPPV